MISRSRSSRAPVDLQSAQSCSIAVRSSSFSTQTLCPRMGVLVLAEQPLLAYMSVDLRGLKAGMTEKLLDDPDVGAPVEQVGGEGVPQRVGMGRRHRAVVE